MNDEQVKALGALLRQRRKELGYSTYELAQAAGVYQSTVVRFEQGRFTAPRPDKLATFARLLGMSVAEVFAKIGYVVPDDLPGFETYLKTKYPGLPAIAISELLKLFEILVDQHDIEVEPGDSAWRSDNDPEGAPA